MSFKIYLSPPYHLFFLYNKRSPVMLNAKRQHQQSKKKNGLLILLNTLIIFMILFNIFIYLLNKKILSSKSSRYTFQTYNFHSSKIKTTNESQMNHIRYQFKDYFKDSYTEKELKEALEGLHLPTWSRGYLDCNDNRSEITCPQIVHAWRILNGWAEDQKKGFANHKHYIMQHLYDGVGNRMSTDMVTFLIALMDNRTYTVQAVHPSADPKKSFGQAFDFHPAVTYRGGDNEEVNKYFEQNIGTAYEIQTFDRWFSYDYKQLFQTYPLLSTTYLLFATMPYSHYQLSEFCFEHFGIHATYFICNFLMRIPDIAMDQAKKVVDSVPPNIQLFGVHLRFQEPNHFFAYNVQRTISTVEGFLQDRASKKPTMFALATDSSAMERQFKSIFPNTICTTALRIPDADHLSALYDIALLEYCEKHLLTYRSTFSYIVMMRLGRNAWFVEKESPGVFNISNSQASMISFIYHQYDVNDWQTTRRFRLTAPGEKAFRMYFKYFIL